jgi:diaminopimelate epimerase
VLVEARGLTGDMPELARKVCDRHYGIGADGLLLLLPSKKADLRMVIYNADGTEAEACGNGLRCLVRYAADKGIIKADSSEVKIETSAGLRKASIFKDGNDISKIQVAMGKPELEVSKIPVRLEPADYQLNIKNSYSIDIENTQLNLSFVSMGNPHAVCFTENPVFEFPLETIGPLVEKHSMFPDRTNFEVAQVLNRKEIEARVWERGVGETLACGSGACAIAVAAQLKGYTGKNIDIRLPGGKLEVSWDGEGEVLLAGGAEIVFTGDWRD